MHDLSTNHWHEPAGHRRAGWGTFQKQPTPYDAFMESEGIPVFRGLGLRRVQDLELHPWKRTGGRGHYIQLYGTETKWGCYVIEVPPGGALHPEKHMFEKIMFVVEGGLIYLDKPVGGSLAAYEDGFTALEFCRKYYREAGLDADELDLLVR